MIVPLKMSDENKRARTFQFVSAFSKSTIKIFVKCEGPRATIAKRSTNSLLPELELAGSKAEDHHVHDRLWSLS